MKAIIVEDEKLNSDLLQTMLNDFVPEVEVIAVCQGVQEAYKTIQQSQNTELVLFLDIELGSNENGFDLLKLIENAKHKVIVVSAFPNYAIQAFRNRTVDFLLKPTRISELIEAVNRVKEMIALESNVSTSNRPNELMVQLFNKYIPVPMNDIVYIKSEDGKSQIFLTGDRIINSIERIGEIELKLTKDSFFRTHQSYIVNLNYLTAFIKEESTQVELENKHLIPVSRRSKSELQTILKDRK